MYLSYSRTFTLLLCNIDYKSSPDSESVGPDSEHSKMSEGAVKLICNASGNVCFCAIVGVCAHVHAVHLHVLVWEVSLSSLSAANLLSTPGG